MIKKKFGFCGLVLAMLLTVILSFAACGGSNEGGGGGGDTPEPQPEVPGFTDENDVRAQYNNRPAAVQDDQYRTYYEIFVRSFSDSDGDGIGDLKGVLNRLDYLNDGDPNTYDDLGITGIWLMPISPSPSYHKYDVKDYLSVDPQYGTMDDLEKLVTECHKRGIKLILDLVLNHTSYDHPWFQEARRALNAGEFDNPFIDYYNITNDPAEMTGSYYANGMPNGYRYEAVFWDQMPDLNYENQNLRNEIANVAKFWLGKGIDGFRLDAAMHIYNNDEEKNLAFWQWFGSECRSVNPDTYLVGEVWTAKNTIIDYYGVLNSCFDYSYALQEKAGIADAAMGNVTGFVSSYSQYQLRIKEKNSAAISAPFLSNHDNNRTGGFLPVDTFRAQMAASVLLLSPGNPYIYYGEELGMKGSGKDENKRLKMLWGDGDSVQSPPGSDYTKQITTTVQSQLKDRNSTLYHYRELLKIRNAHPELARGEMTPLDLGLGTKIAAYTVSYGGKTLTVVHNASDEDAVVTSICTQILGFVGQSGAPSISAGKLTLPKKASVVLGL